jgi:pimeloyl-ACP methyl ester carboxylesterase
MQETAARIPEATYVEMKGTGHLSNLDDPEAFSKHVLEFLANVDHQMGRS